MKLLSARKKNDHPWDFSNLIHPSDSSEFCCPGKNLRAPTAVVVLVSVWGLICGCAKSGGATPDQRPAPSDSAPSDSISAAEQSAMMNELHIGTGSVERAGSETDLVGQRRDVFRQGISLLLPLHASESQAERAGSWSRLGSEESGITFWVMHQPARRTVTIAECESAARLSLSLLRHGTESSHERPFNQPDGYAGTMSVVMLENGGGLVEVFAVGVGRCLSLVAAIPQGPSFSDQLRTTVLDVFPSIRQIERVPQRDSQSF